MTGVKYHGTVGYIGLGDMGGGIATHLAETGTDLIVYDLKQAAIDVLVSKGARGASSLGALVQASDVIIICVDPEPNVPKVVEGVVEYLRPGQTVIIQSSVRPQVVIEAAETVAAKGATLFDAPVSGSYEDRLNGTLAVPTGARREDIGDLAALLETIGRPVYLNVLGGGEVAKLSNNAIMSLTRSGVMEMINMARAFGVPEEDLMKVLEIGSASSFVVHNWSFYDELARKGQVLKQQKRQTTEILKIAKEKNVRLPMTEALFEHIEGLDEERYRFLTGKEPDFDY